MDVEALAVAEIQRTIARCAHLKPFIAANDKTPFTDGHIDVYSGLGQKNVDWLGRVPIQVKGRSDPRKHRDQVSFAIPRRDLLGFRQDSGVLYFYVAVDKNGGCSPYFSLLSPFEIERYLSTEPADTATISVSFKPFPDTSDLIESTLVVALRTRKQQPSFGYDPKLFESMASLTVHSATELNLDEPLRLAPGKSDYAIELTTEGGLTLPLRGELHIYPQEYIERLIDVSIGAGGVSYESISFRRIDAKTIEMHLGTAVTLTLHANDTHLALNISYTTPSNFAERLKATRFLIGVIDEHGVKINGVANSLGGVIGEFATHGDKLREHLSSLEEMEELFRRLGVDDSLVNLDEIEADDYVRLKVLHRAFVDQEEPRNKSGDTARRLLHLGRWVIMFMTVQGAEPDTWRYIDPFDPAAPHMFGGHVENDASNVVPVTAYDIVEQEYLPSILNLHLDRILDAYEAIADNAHTPSLANQRVLALILAADVSKERRSEFLEAATVLNEWLIDQKGETSVHLINRWQIMHRKTGLSREHRDTIRRLKRQAARGDAAMAEEIELSCVLLLGDTEEANSLIGELEEKKLAAIRTWPIWHLHATNSVRVEEASQDTEQVK